MDKEEKKAELSIRNNIVKWLNIEGLDSAVYVLGNKIIGKTTVCHLLKKVIDDFNDPSLKFVQKKKQFEYEYEGQINPKATKPLTIYPKLYRIEKTNTNLIQVPPKFYDLQKKRPYLDRLIALVGIAYTARKGKFLFFVDANKTSGKLDHWKKSFPTVLDAFEDKFFDQNALNSMGFVFTKAKESQKQVYLNRIPDLCKTFTKDDVQKDLYLNLLNIISNNQRVGVFSKFTSEQAAESQAKSIAEMYQGLTETNFVNIDNGREQRMLKIEPVELSKDEKDLYNNFVEPLKLIMDFFTQFYQKIFSTKGPVDIKQFLNQKVESLKEIAEKISSDSDKQQGEESKVLNERYSQLMQISAKKKDFYQSPWGKCLFFVDFKSKIFTQQNLGYKSLTTILQVLAEHGLLIKELEEQFKPLYMELIIFSLFEERFGPLIVGFDFTSFFRSEAMIKIFSEENQLQLKNQSLNPQSFSSFESPENIEIIQNALDRLFPDSQISDPSIKQKKESIKNALATSSFDTSCPQKGIPKIYEQIYNIIYVKKTPEEISANRVENPEKTIASLNKLALILAQMLNNYKRGDLCVGIFKDSGNFIKAKSCLEQLLNPIKQQKKSVDVAEPIIMSYIDLLIEMGLLETAMNTCYQYAQIYNELRSKLFGKMILVRKKYHQTFSQDFELRFTGKSVKLFDFFRDKEIHQEVRKIVDELNK